MPSKKRSTYKEVSEKGSTKAQEGFDLLEEVEEEEEVEYELDKDAEAKIDEILSTGIAPAFVNPQSERTDEYPTETHLKCKVKHTPGDIAPPFAETLIIRKP